MRLRKVLAMAAASAVTVALSLTAASPASAALPDHSMQTTDGGAKGGHMSFTENGDYVSLYDIDADGYSANLIVSISESRSFKLKASGNNASAHSNAAKGGVHNLPENKTICFQIYLQKGNGPFVGSNQKCWYNDN